MEQELDSRRILQANVNSVVSYETFMPKQVE